MTYHPYDNTVKNRQTNTLTRANDMKIFFRLMTTIFAIFLISACANHSNPFWHSDKNQSTSNSANSHHANDSNQSSQHLSGSINGNVYTATIGTNPGNDSFRVNIPQASKADVWASTQKQDQMTNNKTSVNFGPSYNDQSTYRLRVAALPVKRQSFKLFSQGALTEVINEMKADYSSSPVSLYQNYQIINGHSTRVAIFSQQASDANAPTWVQIVYIVKQHNNIATFWISETDKSKTTASSRHRRHAAIMMGIHDPMAQGFIHSFTLIPASTNSQSKT